MAFVSQGFVGHVTFEDNGGNKTTRTYHLRATTADDAGDAMTTIIAAAAAVSDALIIDYDFGEVFGQDSGSYPASGVQIENQALITTQLATFNKVATYTIPAPKPAMFVAMSGPGANEVNPTYAALVTYEGLFTAAGVATISDGEDATAIQNGKRIHRKSNKG